jgi:hypothetical protein
MGMVVMSKRELNRLDVLARLDGDRLTARAAAELMTITPRQAYRLLRGYRDGGASAITHQRCGRPSCNPLPHVVHDHAIAIHRFFAVQGDPFVGGSKSAADSRSARLLGAVGKSYACAPRHRSHSCGRCCRRPVQFPRAAAAPLPAEIPQLLLPGVRPESNVRTIRGKIGGGWKTPFDDPIPLARGRQLAPSNAFFETKDIRDQNVSPRSAWPTTVIGTRPRLAQIGEGHACC